MGDLAGIYDKYSMTVHGWTPQRLRGAMIAFALFGSLLGLWVWHRGVRFDAAGYTYRPWLSSSVTVPYGEIVSVELREGTPGWRGRADTQLVLLLRSGAEVEVAGGQSKADKPRLAEIAATGAGVPVLRMPAMP